MIFVSRFSVQRYENFEFHEPIGADILYSAENIPWKR